MGGWEQGLKGAGGGALAGAGIGGPIGGVIGGLAGGLAGYFGGGESENDQKNRQMLQDYYNNVMNRQTPQAGPAAQAGYSGFRNNQSDLINRLEALSRGQGPSLAAQQFQQATDRNMASQQALAGGGRGGPMAAFNAANNMGMLGANAAQGSAQARIAEQQMALGMLGQNIQAGRGADESTNQFNAGQTNDMARANLEARLRKMGYDDQTILGILSQMGGQNARQAATPGLGDQLLAGGAGLFALGASQRGSTPPSSPTGTPSVALANAGGSPFNGMGMGGAVGATNAGAPSGFWKRSGF